MYSSWPYILAHRKWPTSGLFFVNIDCSTKYVSDSDKTFLGTNIKCLVSVNTIIFELFPFLFTFIVCFHHDTLPKSKELTPDVKKVIVDLSTQGFSGKKIGDLLDIKPRTAQNFLKRYHERGYIENVPRSGRKKRCTRRDTRTFLHIVRSNRRSTLKDMTAKFNNRDIFNYSIRSIRRRLFDSGFKRRPMSKKITIGRSIQSGKTTSIL